MTLPYVILTVWEGLPSIARICATQEGANGCDIYRHL